MWLGIARRKTRASKQGCWIETLQVLTDRDAWYEVNKNFSKVGSDMETIALFLSGSSAPGMCSVMENANRFKLVSDAPPGSEDKLPSGAKAGDMVQMIISSTIWWGEGGKVTDEMEYGRLVWKGFTLEDWDRHGHGQRGAHRALRAKL